MLQSKVAWLSLVMAVCLLGPNNSASAQSSPFQFDALGSISFDAGQMSYGDLNLPARAMTVWTFSVLPGVRYGQWFAGMHLDYQNQAQQTALAQTRRTNFRGHAILSGLALHYTINDMFAVQGTVDFLGAYFFSNRSGDDDSVRLLWPVSTRIKGQYFFCFLPISIDVEAQYQAWFTLKAGEVSQNKTAMEWLLGAGVSFHLGRLLELLK